MADYLKHAGQGGGRCVSYNPQSSVWFGLADKSTLDLRQRFFFKEIRKKIIFWSDVDKEIMSCLLIQVIIDFCLNLT